MEGPMILAHPNIPKPLHGLAPRRIYDGAWWGQMRKLAIAQNSNRCWACGCISQAEFHPLAGGTEYYEVDYKIGRMYFRVVFLCQYAHNFIHSQRLWLSC